MEARITFHDMVERVIVKNINGDIKPPAAILKELLSEFILQKLNDVARPLPEESACQLVEEYVKKMDKPCSLFPLSFELKLARELIKSFNTDSLRDPVSTAVLRLNALNDNHLKDKQHKGSDLALLLAAFFSVYERCGRQLDNGVVDGLLPLANVWQQHILRLIQLILDDTQAGSEYIKRNTFETLSSMTWIPETMHDAVTQAILTQINNTNSSINPNAALYKVVVECMITLKDSIAMDKRAALIDVMQRNIHHDNQVIRNAACNAVIQLRDWLPVTQKAINVDSCLEKMGHTQTVWFIKKACMILGNVAPVIPYEKTGVVVDALLNAATHADAIIRNSAICALGRLGEKIPHDKRDQLFACLFTSLNDSEIIVRIEAYKAVGLLKKLIPQSSHAESIALLLDAIRAVIPEDADEKTAGEIKQIRVLALETASQFFDVMPELTCEEYIEVTLKILSDQTELDTLRMAACKAMVRMIPRMFHETRSQALISLSGIMLMNATSPYLKAATIEAYAAMHQASRYKHYDADMAGNLQLIASEKEQPLNVRLAAMQAACKMASRAPDRVPQEELIDQLLKRIMDEKERKAIKIQACKLICQLDLALVHAQLPELIVDLLHEIKSCRDAHTRAANVEILQCLAKRLPDHQYMDVIDCLLELMNDKFRNVRLKAYAAIHVYLDYMDHDKRMAALSRLYFTAAMEKTCHHKSKLLLMDLYQVHWRTLAAENLHLAAQAHEYKDRNNHTFSIDLPAEIAQSIAHRVI